MRQRRNFNQAYKRNFSVGLATIIILSILLVGMYALFRISQGNKLAASTDVLHELESRKEELIAEKERLEVEATRLQSIREIENDVKSGKSDTFVPTGKINYLPTTSVALK